MRSNALCLIFGVFFTLFTASLAQAQYRTSIQGVVTDPTGAAIQGANVTLTNPATGEAQARVTDAAGVYNFNALPIAKYSLTVEKTGFKKKVIDAVGLIPEQANALNIQLDIGEVTQSVTVTGNEVPLIDTETASINGVVSSNQIQHLPSFGRDPLKLAQLAPGAFGDGSQAGGGGAFYDIPGVSGQTNAGQSGGADGIFKTENGTGVISNGQPGENNGVSIDGISTNSVVWGGSTIITPSEDSIDSVKIVTNSYDAEDGRFSGAQLQIISKQGTNDFHGSLFLTSHQPGLNAYQRFNGAGLNVTKDANKFEQFGGSVGGPIWKNKVFFFFNYETVREPTSNQQGNGWFDTAAFDALAPSGSIASKYLSFPGNAPLGTLNANATCQDAGLVEGVNCRMIAGQGLNIGTPLTGALGTQDFGYMSPTQPGTGGDGSGGPENLGTTADIANYSIVNPTHFTATQYNGRIDANVTQKDRVGFAIYWVPLSRDSLNGLRSYDIFHHNQTNRALSAIWDHTISSDLLNEFRVNAANWKWNEITDNPQSPVGFPTDFIETAGNITINNFGPNVGSTLDQWTYTFKDVATKIYGRHTIKFGGEATRLFYLNECAGCGVPQYRFFNIWDFLNDAPHSENGSFDPMTGFPSTFRQDTRENLWALFIQDDFKLRRNLTLNLGLRWSYFGPLSSKQGNMFRAFPGAGANFLTDLVVRRAHSWDAQKDNFGPQVGLAWSPSRFQDRLAIRGGYGLSYNAQELAISANISQNPGLFFFPNLTMTTPSASSCQNALPNCGILYALSSSPNAIGGYPSNPGTITAFNANGLPTSGSPVFLFPGTLPTTRTHHYSLDAEYDLGHDFVASLGYQGSLSRDAFFNQNPLAVPATQGLTFNPLITGGDYYSLRGRGNYNALLAELKHRFSHSFQGDVQYTWSKCMDTSSGPFSEQFYPYNLDLDYGRCDYNVGQAFKIFGVWQPVFFHNSESWLHQIVDGWSLSGIFNIHSGFPWNPVVSFFGQGSLYCQQCGYSQVLPIDYLGGAGGSTSIDAFKTVAQSNFPNGGAAYFAAQQCTAVITTDCYPVFNASGSSGTAVPTMPAFRRNSLNLPGYKDVDLTLAKAFGFPKAPVLGENAKVELRIDAYNLFNNLNLNPNSIQRDINSGNFGTITSALAARVVTLGIRFSF